MIDNPHDDGKSPVANIRVSMARLEGTVGSVREKIDGIEGKIDRMESHIDGRYVTQQEFEPIRNLVYGVVGTVLLSVLGAVIALVVRGGS